MPLTIIATPGAVDANSYNTLEYADAYFAAHPFAALWIAETDDDVRRAWLIHAARGAIDRVCYTFTSESATQGLRFPGSGLKERGHLVPAATIPLSIKHAHLEWALIIARAATENDEDPSLQSDATALGLKSLTAGPVSLGWKDTIPYQVIPDSVKAYLNPDWLCPDPSLVKIRFRAFDSAS